MATDGKVHLIAIVGSIRKDSVNRKLARAFAEVAAEAGAETELVEINELPLFSEDLEADFPAVAAALREKVRAAHGVVVVTPEYNRSVPGVLKNAIDWSSRPYGSGAWAGKPTAILGATWGGTGTSMAQAHLKDVLLYLDARVLGQPEFYMGGAPGKFDAEGKLTDAATREHLVAVAAKLIAETKRA